jgi:hypothetical protein
MADHWTGELCPSFLSTTEFFMYIILEGIHNDSVSEGERNKFP